MLLGPNRQRSKPSPRASATQRTPPTLPAPADKRATPVSLLPSLSRSGREAQRTSNSSPRTPLLFPAHGPHPLPNFPPRACSRAAQPAPTLKPAPAQPLSPRPIPHPASRPDLPRTLLGPAHAPEPSNRARRVSLADAVALPVSLVSFLPRLPCARHAEIPGGRSLWGTHAQDRRRSPIKGSPASPTLLLPSAAARTLATHSNLPRRRRSSAPSRTRPSTAPRASTTPDIAPPEPQVSPRALLPRPRALHAPDSTPRTTAGKWLRHHDFSPLWMLRPP